MADNDSQNNLDHILRLLKNHPSDGFQIPIYGMAQNINENLLKFHKFKHYTNIPALLFYNLNTLDLIDCYDKLQKTQISQVISILSNLQSSQYGGFGSMYKDTPDLIVSYFSICVLAIIGSNEAFESINRSLMFEFISSLRIGDGSFLSNQIGDIDLRCIYCALVISNLLNLPNQDMMFANSQEYILRCQSECGGFSSSPGCEVHSGYTYCAVASLVMLNAFHKCNIDNLKKWIMKRSKSIEGAFNGRPGKVFCSCYTLYVGSIIKIIVSYSNKENDTIQTNLSEYYDEKKLATCLRSSFDHNSCNFGKNPDFKGDIYHTCYCLGGLSVLGSTELLGSKLFYDNSPIFNIRKEKVENMYNFFRNK